MEGWRDARGGGGGEGNPAVAETNANQNGNGNGNGSGSELAEGASGGLARAVQPQGVHGGVLPKGVGGKAAPGYSI